MYLFVIFILVVFFALYKYTKRTKKDTLLGKHVVITGGSSGIGKALAIQVASLGADVTVISRNVKNLEETVTQILKKCSNPQKQKIQYLSLDVTVNYAKIEEELKRIEENVGPVYMLVNSAGSSICGRLEDMSVENINFMMNLNYLGSVYPTKALIGDMKARGAGIIVLVSSAAGLLGVYGMGPYAAAKWAIRGLGETLQTEVVGTEVSVTISYPPDTDTPGFLVEQQTKPIETKLISESAGLASSEDVAKQIICDALDRKPYSVFGFESWMLACLCVTSYSGIIDALIQATLFPLIRIVFAFYQMHFRNIVLKCRKATNMKKKAN